MIRKNKFKDYSQNISKGSENRHLKFIQSLKGDQPIVHQLRKTKINKVVFQWILYKTQTTFQMREIHLSN